MERWLEPALDYIPRWMEFQMRQSGIPGCAMAIAHRGRPLLDLAWGQADLGSGEKLTPRHRFRVASHSKSFTAAGLMKLREARKLKLDDEVGEYVAGLHRDLARATLAQLMSHAAGVVRDGWDSGYWLGRRRFVSAAELRAELKKPPVIETNSRFKYSNHGYGLLGLVIEAITGESYNAWIAREIVAAAGLKETQPDAPLKRSAKLATGHSPVAADGRRYILPAGIVTHALSPATGFISTAKDLALFYAQLAPKAAQSFLSAASRREMQRRQWRVPHNSMESHYGLGVNSGNVQDWEWYGHGGGFPGAISLSGYVPAADLSISVLTNSGDGLAGPWMGGALQVLRAFKLNGPPARRIVGWRGRWSSQFGTGDWLPMGNKVVIASPGFFNPLMDATEIEVLSRNKGRVMLANGFGAHGEQALLHRNKLGRVVAATLGGAKMHGPKAALREVQKRYKTAPKKR